MIVLEPAPPNHCLLCKKRIEKSEQVECPQCKQTFCKKCFTKPCVPWRDKK